MQKAKAELKAKKRWKGKLKRWRVEGKKGKKELNNKKEPRGKEFRKLNNKRKKD